MDNIAIENFINFCDDMQIVEEGFSVNDILHVIDILIEKMKNLYATVQSKYRQYVTRNIEGFSVSKVFFKYYKIYIKTLHEYYKSLATNITESPNISELEDAKKKCDEAYSVLLSKVEWLAKANIEHTAQNAINIENDGSNFGLNRIKDANNLLTRIKDVCRRNPDYDKQIISFCKDYCQKLCSNYEFLFKAIKSVRKKDDN